MVNRIILNETSYHGAGAVQSIVAELAARGLKKPIVFSDPDLIKFGVTKKVTDLLAKAKTYNTHKFNGYTMKVCSK